MIDETIGKIEERLRQSSSIPEEKRTELLQLLSLLRSEVGQLTPMHSEAARTIADQTEQSTSAATSSERDPASLQESLDSLSASVTDFEESHPRLVQVVNRICVTLSNLGI